MKPGYEQIRNDREINLLIEQGNRNLKVRNWGIGDDRWRWQKLQAICMISEIP